MLTIRHATFKDSSALADLHLRQLGQPALSDGDANHYQTAFATFLDRALSGGNWTVWVAGDEQQLLLALYLVMLRRLPHPTRRDAPVGILTQLDALPAALDESVMLPVLRNLINWCRSQGLGMIHISPWLPVLPFYQKLGFQRCDRALLLELERE
ncbi:MAG TPA: hypothetical protein PLS90_06060 [Candidatus Sumerlaeota bacterium]|nr:MAG: hypothetical protein BWZ08_02080 [candidate division BRC1 bacterium ADurb.BinA292]HOE96257.1 hypothetical protein [Candidatus Sumerlaeota bacterium]HOR27430.1 hypothetical protein [Candidatus Sumerlaeota bacterium]HPK02003.1 hypothetical protein [Candidatus Sumerlaeota bacterium]